MVFDNSRLQKPESRKRTKARKDRQESAVVQSVRPQVVDRDGYCRLQWDDAVTQEVIHELFGKCHGYSEWSHFNRTHRRSKTRNMAPELRHDRRYSLMLCSAHSHLYDRNEMDIIEKTPECCDGPLTFKCSRGEWAEP